MFIVLFLVVCCAALLAGGLAVTGGRCLEARGLLKATAFFAGACAVLLYAWGLLHVTGAVMQADDGGTDSSPPRPCRSAGAQIANEVEGYQVSYIPLAFECVGRGGVLYVPPVVPRYVSPAAAALGAVGIATGAFAAVTAARRPAAGATADA